MFINNAHAIATKIHFAKNGEIAAYVSDFFPLVTKKSRRKKFLVKNALNGTTYHNVPIDIDTGEQSLILQFEQKIDKAVVSSIMQVQDETISKRIITYLEKYYGKHATNCASFAEYIATGVFQEGVIGSAGFTYSSMLTSYSDQKMKLGDIACILYFNKLARSRKYPEIRARYITCAKNGGMSLEPLKVLHKRTFSAERVMNFFLSGIVSDFHFMVCIGEHNGQPVFIQQAARHMPGDDDPFSAAPILISVGFHALVSYYEVPGMVFIKKRCI